jgi:hypothetical protein
VVKVRDDKRALRPKCDGEEEEAAAASVSPIRAFALLLRPIPWLPPANPIRLAIVVLVVLWREGVLGGEGVRKPMRPPGVTSMLAWGDPRLEDGEVGRSRPASRWVFEESETERVPNRCCCWLLLLVLGGGVPALAGDTLLGCTAES